MSANRARRRSPESYCELYRSLFELSGTGMANLDVGLRIREANQVFVRQFGPSQGALRGKAIQQFIQAGARDELAGEFARLVEGRVRRFTGRVPAIGHQHNLFCAELTAIAVRRTGSGVTTIIVLSRPWGAETSPAPATESRRLFSPVDARILEGVAAGDSTLELAAKLFLSRSGVEYHLTSLLRKLKVPNRPALVARSYTLGVFATGQWPPRVLPEYLSS